MKDHRPSFKKRIALNVFKKYVDVQTELHELSYLFWECTLRCNINCQHCGSDCHSDYKIKDLPVEDFLKVTKEISKNYNPNKVMVVITGGEPLLRNDLEECGKELYKQGYPWGFVTNGYALTENRFRNLINSGLRSMTISLDGLKDSHNWLRGNSRSFEKAIAAITILCAEKNFTFDVVTCVNQRNINELYEIKKLLIKMGVKRWRVFTICPIGRAKENELLNITDSQFVKIMEFIKQTRKEGIIAASYGCEGFLGNFETEARDGYFFCRAGINIASVLADGSICACPNIDRNSFTQGNIYTDSFMDVWKNRFQNMRNREWARTGTCAECKEFKWCRGNAIHLRDTKNNDVLRCHYNMIKNG